MFRNKIICIAGEEIQWNVPKDNELLAHLLQSKK